MLSDFQNWLKSPFASNMDAMHWFLFYGLLIIIAVLWSFILRAIRGE